MKKIFVSLIIVAGLFSCDKIDNPYPPKLEGELDQSLFPGNFADYPWPVFQENTNTDRNVLVEDFTGHKCVYCPAAGDTAHLLKEDYEGRVFVSTIHSGPTGPEAFQDFSSAPFTYNFTNPIGTTIARYIAGLPSSGFSGNPRGSISRRIYNNNIAFAANQWRAAAVALMDQNDLKVNLQAVVNYYPETDGAFIHIEAEVLDASLDPSNLGLVVGFYEDSIVKPQLYPSTSPYPNHINDNYVHHDLLKSHLNGDVNGTTLVEKYRENGKYRLDYSFKIVAPYTAENAHFLIYVVDKTTSEVYHVIKKKVKP